MVREGRSALSSFSARRTAGLRRVVLDWQPRGLRSFDLIAKDEFFGLEQKSRNLARSFENMNNRLLNFLARRD